MDKEIIQFLGTCLYMTVVHQPNIRMYWSKQTGDVNIKKYSMGRIRFEQILRCLHFADNDLAAPRGQPGHDRLYKIRPFLNNLQANFRKYVEPETLSSIDEMMIPFKGKSILKQYMTNKPSKWGFKFWVQAGVSGFVHEFLITGDNLYASPDPVDEVGKSGQVVLDLVKNLPPGSDVSFDNYFSSTSLLIELAHKNLNATCTMRYPRTGP